MSCQQFFLSSKNAFKQKKALGEWNIQNIQSLVDKHKFF